MKRRATHVLPAGEQERLRREVAELLEEIAVRVRLRERRRNLGAGEEELERRRAEIAKLHWRLASAARESARPFGPEAA